MGVTQAAGLPLKWFRDTFCRAEIDTAASMDVDPYDLMNKEAALSPIGANRLFYLPYLMGERTPHPTRIAVACSLACPRCMASAT